MKKKSNPWQETVDSIKYRYNLTCLLLKNGKSGYKKRKLNKENLKQFLYEKGVVIQEQTDTGFYHLPNPAMPFCEFCWEVEHRHITGPNNYSKEAYTINMTDVGIDVVAELIKNPKHDVHMVAHHFKREILAKQEKEEDESSEWGGSVSFDPEHEKKTLEKLVQIVMANKQEGTVNIEAYVDDLIIETAIEDPHIFDQKTLTEKEKKKVKNAKRIKLHMEKCNKPKSLTEKIKSFIS